MKQLFYTVLFLSLFSLEAMNNDTDLNDDEDEPSCCCFLTTIGTASAAGLFTTKKLVSYLPNETTFPLAMGAIAFVGVCTTARELYYAHLDYQDRKNKKKTD